MADIEYTPNLALAKQPTGARGWGDVLNENFDKIDGGFGKTVDWVNITNCITEIPQDIKLELNDGTLTLKAGSKVYVPNGFEQDGTTPKFNEIVVENDLTTTGYNDAYCLILYRTYPDEMLTAIPISSCATVASLPSTNGVYYDTSVNQVYRINSNIKDMLFGFPIGVFTRVSGVITSIDQVFNGFGYIGSTVFALPGVKGLIPNGRNADGTLKSTEYTIGSVLTHTTTAQDVVAYLAINSSMVALAAKFVTTYKEKENYVFDEYAQANANWSALGTIMTDANAKITSFASIQPFHAVDYNDLIVKADKSQFQLVSTLPSTPNVDTFYFIPE